MLARIFRGVCAGAAALALVLAPVSRAHAITVFDPTNLTQNLLQATRALEQINTQIRQIEQAAAMLRQNPFQLSPELSQSIGEARRLFSAAEGLAFEVEQLSDDLRTLYPETWEEFDLEDIVGQSDLWMAESRRSLERAMAAEARAAASIGRTQGAIDRALQSSGSSEGQTGAIQAGNQPWAFRPRSAGPRASEDGRDRRLSDASPGTGARSVDLTRPFSSG